MNWAVVILGALALGSLLWWVIDARHWFHGPAITIQVDEKLNPEKFTSHKHASCLSVKDLRLK